MNEKVKSYTGKRWICMSKYRGNQNYSWHTLAWTKKDSIFLCVGDSSYTWKECKSFGWSCVKVELTLTSIK